LKSCQAKLVNLIAMRNRIQKLFLLLFLPACIIALNTCSKLEKLMLVSTGEVTIVLTNYAEATGQVIDLGDGATQHGHCYAKTSNVTIASSKTELGVPLGTGGFTSQITNLEAGTRYYIKAYIGNGTQTTYGEEISFTTVAASMPTLSTTAMGSITQTTASCGGNITSDGGALINVRGVCWNTATGPSINNTKTTDGTGIGSFQSSLADLTPGTTYYVRAYATNSAGTAYGNELSFSTSAVTMLPPTSTTIAATSVTNTTANLNATVNANNSLTTVTFEYGLTSSYGLTSTAVQSPVSGAILKNVSALVTGLISGQTYHYRVKTENEVGTTYGGDITFTTTGALTVADIDGNFYNTIAINTQVWMKENLKTTKYNDGASIPIVTDPTAWTNLSTHGYCWYNNDLTTYSAIYGALYNWYSVSTGKLCPTGWHVPTDAEWTELISYLGGESIAGGKLKESGTAHWVNPNTGAANETGFTALPGGGRNFDGPFLSIGTIGLWWSSTTDFTDNAWNRMMFYDNVNVTRNYTTKRGGFSVRCIKNN
jgi:uncharacterized protein (TIGR02145 family)